MNRWFSRFMRQLSMLCRGFADRAPNRISPFCRTLLERRGGAHPPPKASPMAGGHKIRPCHPCAQSGRETPARVVGAPNRSGGGWSGRPLRGIRLTYESAAGHQRSPHTQAWSQTPRSSRDQRRWDSRPTPARLLHSSVMKHTARKPMDKGSVATCRLRMLSTITARRRFHRLHCMASQQDLQVTPQTGPGPGGTRSSGTLHTPGAV
jgi:hypothetical protein